MITIYKKTLKDDVLREIDKPARGSWISLVNPTKDEINKISADLNIDKKNLLDALDEYELPRLEKHDNAIYVLIKTPIEEKNSIFTIPICIVITNDYIITVTKTMNPVIERMLANNPGVYTTQRINFMIQMFLLVSDMYDVYLKRISKELKRKKAKIRDLSDIDIVNIVKQEEILNDFISSFLPSVIVFEKILGGKVVPLYRQDRDIIEDVLINSRQTLDICRSNIKIATNIREAYSTVLSNNLNKIIKILTFFTIVLAIPTTISSLFGMNVMLPMQDNPNTFLYIVVSVLIVSAILIIIFAKKKWI